MPRRFRRCSRRRPRLSVWISRRSRPLVQEEEAQPIGAVGVGGHRCSRRRRPSVQESWRRRSLDAGGGGHRRRRREKEREKRKMRGREKRRRRGEGEKGEKVTDLFSIYSEGYRRRTNMVVRW
jgi:hypothetical protein